MAMNPPQRPQSWNKFSSKFAISDLVEYEHTNKDLPNIFGHVREITFFQTDKVNVAAYYVIETVNTKTEGCTGRLERGVQEQKIIRRYIPHE